MSDSHLVDVNTFAAACEPFLAAAGIHFQRPRTPVRHYHDHRAIGTVSTRPGMPIRVTPRKGLTLAEEALLRGAAWDAFLNPPSVDTGWRRRGNTWSCTITCDS